MNKISKNQHGYSVIEVILVLVIVGAIAGVGWFVYQSKQSADKTLSTDNSSTPTFKKKTTNTSTNQYAGWRSYCSSYGGLCLKYPSTWKFSTTSTPTYDKDGAETGSTQQANIINPAGTVQVVYNPSEIYPITIGYPLPFTLLSLTSPQSTNDFKIVQGIEGSDKSTNIFTAALYLTTNANIAQDNVRAASKTLTGIDGFFQNAKNKKDSVYQILSVGDSKNQGFYTNFSSTADAKAWFDLPDVQTAGRILGSVSYSQ